MTLFILFIYTAIYFLGYYGAHLLNFLFRRKIISNLRIAGLSLLALAAAVFAFFIEINVHPNTTAYDRGYLQGYLAIGPAVMIGIVVGIRVWLENRRIGKIEKY